MAPVPSADEQLVFLTKMQRLFDRGSFTSTYKYALVIAIADFCIERAAADGSRCERLIEGADGVIDFFRKRAGPCGLGALSHRPGGEVRSGGEPAVPSPAPPRRSPRAR